MTQSVVIDAATRYSPMKFTKSTQQRSLNYTPTNRLNHSKLFTDKYFCHYSNAIYMGGMDSYKKRGHGLLFMDNGACAITYHSHDNMVDHNIVFRDKSMTLMTIKTNKSKSLVYRTGPYLITANFNSRGFVQGIGYLVDFENQKLYKLGYYQSKVDKKQQIKDQKILGNIFSKATYSDIINDQQIIESLNLNFNISSEIRCARQSHQKNSGEADKGDIFTIGMMEKIVSQQKSGPKKEKKQLYSLNGLNFKVKIFLDPKNFDVILIQRGYFQGEKMQKFGEKHFENGNYYIGQFKNNMFDGYGMLIHPEERKWTYGVHKKGELIDMIQSSVSSDHKISQILKLIHQNEENYIKYQIKLQPSQSQLKQLLKNALQLQSNDDFIQDPKQEVLKRLSNLKTIRDDYVKRQYENNTQEAIKQQMSREKKYQYRMFVEGLSAKQASPLQCKRKQNRNMSSSRINKSTNQLQPEIITQKNNQKYLNHDSSKKSINYKSAANFNKNNLNSDKKDRQLNSNKNKSYNTNKSVVKINSNTNDNGIKNNIKNLSSTGKLKKITGVKDGNFSTNNTASTNKTPKLNNAAQGYQINVKMATNSPAYSPSNQLGQQNSKNNNLLKLQPVKQQGYEDKQLSKSKISTNNYLNTPQQNNDSLPGTPNRINKTFIDDISQSRMDKNTVKQPNQKQSRYKYLQSEPNQPGSNSKDKDKDNDNDKNKREVYRYPKNISPLTSGGIPYHGAAHILQKYQHQQTTDNIRLPYNYQRYPYIQHIKNGYYGQYQSQYRMPRRLQRSDILNSSKPYTTNEYYYLQNDLRQYGRSITRDLNKNRLQLEKKIQEQKQIDKYLKTNRNRQMQLERLKKIEEDIRKKQMAKILEQEREKSAERQKEREKERQRERELDRQLLWQRQKQRQLEIQKQKILKLQLQKQRQLELQLERPYLSGLLNSGRRNQYKYLDISNQVDRNLNALGKNRQMYEQSVRSRKFI